VFCGAVCKSWRDRDAFVRVQRSEAANADMSMVRDGPPLRAGASGRQGAVVCRRRCEMRVMRQYAFLQRYAAVRRGARIGAGGTSYRRDEVSLRLSRQPPRRRLSFHLARGSNGAQRVAGKEAWRVAVTHRFRRLRAEPSHGHRKRQ